MAIIGTYLRSVSEATQVSHGLCSTTAHPLIHAERPHGPRLSCRVIAQQRGGGGGWGLTGCEQQRGLSPKAVSEQSCGCLHRQCIGPLQLTGAKSLHGLHLLQYSPLLGQDSQCGEREKHTLKGNRASSGPILATSI